MRSNLIHIVNTSTYSRNSRIRLRRAFKRCNCRDKSGRRGSNPPQPAWKAGVRRNTACLIEAAFTGWLSSVHSFSSERDKSFHLLFLSILTKVFALPRELVFTRCCTHKEYTLQLDRRQIAIQPLFLDQMMLMTRETTNDIMTSARIDSTIMRNFARCERGIVSVGLKAVAAVKAR